MSVATGCEGIVCGGEFALCSRGIGRGAIYGGFEGVRKSAAYDREPGVGSGDLGDTL